MSSPKQAISDQHLAGTGSHGADAAAPAHDDIAQLAYHLWECRTREGADGSPEQDWQEAERRLHLLGHREPG